MYKKALSIYCFGMAVLVAIVLSAGNAGAQSVWLDSLYVRVGEARVDRPAGKDASVIFKLQVYRPVEIWNNNDTTLGSSDFVFGSAGKDLTGIFSDVRVVSLHAGVASDMTGALKLSSRFVLGKLQISLTKTEGSSKSVTLPYREWVDICRVELPLKDPATVELGLLWDKGATGFITKNNIPILEDLKDDLEKIPDTLLTFKDYASSRKVCCREETFFYAHAVSSGTALNCTWKYSTDNGTTFAALNDASDWSGVTVGKDVFQYRIKGEHADTLWLKELPLSLSGILFKCVAEDLTVSSTPRETPEMCLTVLPEVKVALEAYNDFSANLGHAGDTARRCPGEEAVLRVGFYDLQNKSQLQQLKEMGNAYIVYRWVDDLGSTGRDTLKMDMAHLGDEPSVEYKSGSYVITSKSLDLRFSTDGKYYIDEVWTDSCAGTVLCEYDTVVVKQGDNVVYEYAPITYVSGSQDTNVVAGLGVSFTSVTLKPSAIKGTLWGNKYSAPAGQVGTDTVLYKYQSAGGCTITAIRQINVISGKHVAIKVFLEGPYVTKADSMRAIYVGRFPTISNSYVSPYADKKECLTPFPEFDRAIVDWIYVEVWDYPPYGKFTGDTQKGSLIDSTSALLLADGRIVGVEGKPYVTFDNLPLNSYYVKIKHRNHLSIISAETLTFTPGVPTDTYDFIGKLENTLNKPANITKPAQKNVNGKCVMFGGDLNDDGLISVTDYVLMVKNLTKIGYLVMDLNFDGQVFPVDQKFITNNSNEYVKY